MLGCAEACRKRVYGEDRAVNTKKHNGMQKAAKTEILVYWKHERYFSMQVALHFSQYWNAMPRGSGMTVPQVWGVSFFLLMQHVKGVKNKREKPRQSTGSCHIFPSED